MRKEIAIFFYLSRPFSAKRAPPAHRSTKLRCRTRRVHEKWRNTGLIRVGPISLANGVMSQARNKKIAFLDPWEGASVFRTVPVYWLQRGLIGGSLRLHRPFSSPVGSKIGLGKVQIRSCPVLYLHTALHLPRRSEALTTPFRSKVGSRPQLARLNKHCYLVHPHSSETFLYHACTCNPCSNDLRNLRHIKAVQLERDCSSQAAVPTSLEK